MLRCALSPVVPYAVVRERMSERNPGEITGYAVALPEAVDPGGQPQRPARRDR